MFVTSGSSTARQRTLDHLGAQGADLDPDSSLFQAAFLLLAACEVGQSVHKLSMVTGLPREFVARCARRLVDNGVWQGGETVSPWTSSSTQQAAFWADVGVAEGKLYRRVNAAGEYEWGRPGEWWKEFHYVSSPEAYGSPTRYYQPSPAETPDDSPHQFLSRLSEEPAPEKVAVRNETQLPGSRASRAMPGGVVVVGSTALFGEAVWLS